MGFTLSPYEIVVELFEEEKRLKKVRERYLALKNYFDDTFIVDGDRKVEKVSKDIREVIEECFIPILSPSKGV